MSVWTPVRNLRRLAPIESEFQPYAAIFDAVLVGVASHCQAHDFVNMIFMVRLKRSPLNVNI